MTAVGVALLGVAVLLLWAAWNDENPVALVANTLGGK